MDPVQYVPVPDDEAAEQIEAAMAPGMNISGYLIVEILRSQGYVVCRAEP